MTNARAVELGQPPVIAGEPAVSSVFVPLVVGGRATGVISLQNIDRARVQRRRRPTARPLAAASPWRSRTPGCSRRRQRNAELALINDVQRGLAENLDMQSMYELVGDRIQEIFDAQVVDIGIADRDEPDPLSVHIERGVRLPDLPIDIGPGPASHVLETREPLLISERIGEHVVELRRDHPGEPRSLQSGSRSWSAVQRRACLAPEHRSRTRLQRGGRPAPDDARRQPLRCARERPALRGGEAEERGTRTHHRRPAGTSSEPRHAVDV